MTNDEVRRVFHARPLTVEEVKRMFHAIDESRTNREWREAHGMARRVGWRTALRIALATLELHTGNGCQNPKVLVKDAAGDVDYEATVALLRAVLVKP